MADDILPEPIGDELFNLQHRPSEMALDYLADALAEFGLIVTAIDMGNAVVTIRAASRDRRLFATVRVQRVERNFAIEAALDGDQFLPAEGEWAAIRKYCGALVLTRSATTGARRGGWMYGQG